MKKPGCNNTRWMRGRLEINKNCAMYRDIEEIKETNVVQYDIVSWSQYVTGFRGIAMGLFDIRIKRTNSKYKEERSISAAFESRDWCTAYSLPPFRRSSFPLFFFLACFALYFFFFVDVLYFYCFYSFPAHHRLRAMSRTYILYVERDVLRSTMYSLWPPRPETNVILHG